MIGERQRVRRVDDASSASHRVTRTDIFEIDVRSLERAVRTPEGFLRLDGWLFRSGVQVYWDAATGAERREYRDPADVFSQAHLDAHRMLPVTDDHPVDDVTPVNATELVRGAVGQDVRRDGERARASIIVYEASLIDAIVAKRKTHLSVGYSCKIDPTPGRLPSGETYQVRQYDHKPNHIAVVAEGRAGNAVVRVDRRDHADQRLPAQRKDTIMDEEQMKAFAATVANAVAAALKPAETETETDAEEDPKEDPEKDPKADKRDRQRARADLAERDLLAVQRDLRAVQTKLDAAEKAAKTSATKGREIVRARVALDRVGSVACPELYEVGTDGVARADAMGDREIMVAVVKRVDDIDIPAERGDEYVRGAFELAARRANGARGDYATLDTIVQARDTAPTSSHAPAALNADEGHAAYMKLITGGSLYGAQKAGA